MLLNQNQTRKLKNPEEPEPLVTRPGNPPKNPFKPKPERKDPSEPPNTSPIVTPQPKKTGTKPKRTTQPYNHTKAQPTIRSMLEPKTKDHQQHQNPATPGPNNKMREKPTLPRTTVNTNTNQTPEPTTNHPLNIGTKPPSCLLGTKTNYQPKPATPRPNQNQNQGESDRVIPDRDRIPGGDRVEKSNGPETRVNTRKPTKLKPKVVQVPDIKLFLAKKRKERDLKLNLVRGTDLLNCCDKPPSVMSDSATLPPTLPPNSLNQRARGTPDTRNAALYTENCEGDQKISANLNGIPDLSG